MYRPKAQATPTGLATTVCSEWYANTRNLMIRRQQREDLITRTADLITTDRRNPRLAILAEVAIAQCELCRDGVKVIMLDGHCCHDVPDGLDECTAAAIQEMIFRQLIAEQEVTRG